MTSREFDVFFFLVHRAGQVLSKRHILDGVWSDDFMGDPDHSPGARFVVRFPLNR